MATMEDIYRKIASFSEPAYTYIIRLPYPEWKKYEHEMQMSIKGGLWNNILEDQEQYNLRARHFDPSQLYTMHYQASLGALAYYAVQDCFREKQCTKNEKFSAFVQVECTENVHIHLVLAGHGLNKYNAKQWRNLIGRKFFDKLIERQEANLGPAINEVQWLSCTTPPILASRDAAQGNTQAVTILQYRARNGDMYACRVDPATFIANYLLPKNLWLNSYTYTEAITPTEAYFPASEKTYSYSLVNGHEIPIDLRRAIQEKLAGIFNGQKSEPVFAGDPYGDLPKVGKAEWTRTTQPAGRMTKREGLVLDCMNRAIEENLLTYEQMVNTHPELVVMMESQPGGARLLEQTLNMAHIKIVQTHTALSYVRHLFPEQEVEPDNKVFHLLNIQGYNAWQVGHWVCTVLNKKAGKQNTVCFYGPASTGKTNLAKAIVNTVRLYGCVNHQNKSFVFNDCAAKLVIWWEECLMHNDWVEQAKCCLGGTEFRIDRKHKESQLLPQTPVVISTNHNIYEVTGGNVVSGVHAKPLKDRVVQFNFMKCLQSTFGEIPVKDCADWLVDCSNRFECTLEGFYQQWGMDAVHNDFETQKLCASHSQDFTLHEHGLCLQCGGYLPLRLDEECAGQSSPEVLVPGNLDSLLSTPVKQGRLNFDSQFDFDMSLLATPSPPALQLEEVSALAPPRKRIRVDEEGNIKNIQIGNDLLLEGNKSYAILQRPPEAPEWEIRAGLDPEKEPESESSQKGLNPSEWGEKLGVLEGDVETGAAPIVLHCFETIPESDVEEEDMGQ